MSSFSAASIRLLADATANSVPRLEDSVTLADPVTAEMGLERAEVTDAPALETRLGLAPSFADATANSLPRLEDSVTLADPVTAEMGLERAEVTDAPVLETRLEEPADLATLETRLEPCSSSL